MRNLWLNAFIDPDNFPGCKWNAQVLDFNTLDEVDLVNGTMRKGKSEDELILTFLMSEQGEVFDLDELIESLEDSFEAIFDATVDGDVIEMHTVFLWEGEASYEVTKKQDAKVTWRFKHRCLFSGVW